MKISYYMTFANRTDRQIEISKRLAVILSYVFKSPRYILISAETDGYNSAIIEDGIAKDTAFQDVLICEIQCDILGLPYPPVRTKIAGRGIVELSPIENPPV